MPLRGPLKCIYGLRAKVNMYFWNFQPITLVKIGQNVTSLFVSTCDY